MGRLDGKCAYVLGAAGKDNMGQVVVEVTMCKHRGMCNHEPK